MASKMSSVEIKDFNQGWANIHAGITKLTTNLEGASNDESEFRVEEYMKIYRTVYKMCTQKPPHNYPQEVYDKYRETIEEYITSKVLTALNIAGNYSELMLKDIVKIWENYQLMLRMLSNMFYYLDRYFVRKQSLPALREVGNTCFNKWVYHKIYVAVKNAMLILINREREEEEVDRALLNSAFTIFLENGIDFYKNDYEIPVLEETATYYSQKAASWISELSCQEYMLKVEKCFRHEMSVVTDYLHASSLKNLMERLENELIASQKTYLLENEHSGFNALLMDDKKLDLSMMYFFFCRIPDMLESAAKTFEQFVTTQGLTLLAGANDAVNNHARDIIDIVQEFGGKIVQLHDRSRSYVLQVFERHEIFKKALDQAFRVICNQKIAGIASAEFFARFFDNVLREGDIENIVVRAGDLLHYLNDRNTFVEFSIKKLADRLLFHKCSNVDIEKTFLAKIKREFIDGRELNDDLITSKVDEMLRDFDTAADDQARFKEYIDTRSNVEIGMDLTVTGLSGALWPSYKSSQQFNPPSEMVRSIQLFQQFYPNLHKYRNLTWMYSLGTCNVRVYFEQKPIELTVSTYQAAVIMLFKLHSEWFSYEEIKTQLNLEDEEIASVLRSLASENYKILLKEPISETIAPTDKFQLNLKFTDRSNKIKIPFQRRPEEEENEKKKQVISPVDNERSFAIKAAMVRVMKKRQVLTRQQLLSETPEELALYLQHFQPSVQIMEKVIMSLIDEEYLEEGEGSELKYVC